MKFLRGLKRHNDRVWFNARKDVYVRSVKEPMRALVAELNHGIAEFAPELVRPPEKAMLRIYRDTRFSNNKLPYKTHQAAWWGRTGLGKGGGGYYLSVNPEVVTVAAGMYMPEPEQLLAVRRMLLEQHKEFRAALKAATRRGMFAEFSQDALTRPPKGFDAEHPAIDLIKQKSWGVYVDLPAAVALKPSLGNEVLKRFRAAAPLLAMLNGAMQEKKRKPIFGL